MAPQVIPFGAFSVMNSANVVEVSARPDANGWSKNLSSSFLTVSTAIPLKDCTRRAARSSSRGRHYAVPKIECISVSDVPTSSSVSDDVPLKEIPGTYGLPFFGAIKDRLDFMWFQRPPLFYEARRDKYKSTVYRTNVPPGPPFFPDPRVVVLLDEKSYPILFDVGKVEKKDIFVGTYTPSVALTGGYRVLSYLDPSEEKHTLLKNFAFEIIKSSAPRVVPAINVAVTDIFTSLAGTLKKDGKASFAADIQTATFRMVLKSITKQDPYAPVENALGDGASDKVRIWLLSQIGPITPYPAPWYLAPLVELFLHTLPLPTFLSKGIYQKLLDFFSQYGAELLDVAEKQNGLDRNEALHNLVFLTCFNTWGGVNILYPGIVRRLGTTSAEYQKELADEVRKAVETNGGSLSPKALGDMPLVVSAVYEVLRIDPPVPYQYGKAKEDLVIQSHDAAYRIKKGETLAGYLPLASRDPKVFDQADTFLPKRFLGEEGQALLKYVLWSNGPQTEQPTVQNKHCAGKNFVLLVAQLFVASIYLQYDAFEVDSTQAFLTSLKPISSR